MAAPAIPGPLSPRVAAGSAFSSASFGRRFLGGLGDYLWPKPVASPVPDCLLRAGLLVAEAAVCLIFPAGLLVVGRLVVGPFSTSIIPQSESIVQCGQERPLLGGVLELTGEVATAGLGEVLEVRWVETRKSGVLPAPNHGLGSFGPLSKV